MTDETNTSPAPAGQTRAGWNTDPTGRFQLRYWDGAAWTDHVSTNGVQQTDPVAGGAPVTPVVPTTPAPPVMVSVPRPKVVWPTRKEAMQMTGYVFAFVFVMALFLWLTDKTLEWVLYDLILGWRR